MQSYADGIIDRISNDRSHHHDCRLAPALGRVFLAVKDNGLYLRQPGKPRDFIRVKIDVQNLSVFEMDVLLKA